jgi:hypothetical protein
MTSTALGLQEYSFSADDLETCVIRHNNLVADIRRMLGADHGFEALPTRGNSSICVFVDGIGAISGRPVNGFFSDLIGFAVYGAVLIMDHNQDGEPINLVTKEKTVEHWRKDNCIHLKQALGLGV